jgi:hypothetical protein
VGFRKWHLLLLGNKNEVIMGLSEISSGYKYLQTRRLMLAIEISGQNHGYRVA